jgi:general secretion pathway protein F
MKNFNATIISKGKKSIISVQAINKISATKQIKQKNPTAGILKIVEGKAPANVGGSFENLKKTFASSIDISHKISSIRQLAVMTDAGISIYDSIVEVGRNTENPKLKLIYQSVANDINVGKSMTESLEPYKEEFGHVALAMTKLGEQTGNISGSYHTLADIWESVRDNVRKFKKAIRTPIITLVAMMIAFTILIMLVVPKFKEIFEKFNADLPVPTLILLWLENALNNYGIYILLAMAGMLFFFMHQYKNNPAFKYKIDKLLVHPKFYLIKDIIFYSSMHKYTLIFGELIRAGIPVSEALSTAVGMVDNSYIKEKLQGVNADIARGISLSDAFKQTGLFENMLLQMIKAGESSGQLDAMLSKVTQYYDSKFQDLIDNLSTYIEPVLLFFIAGLVLLLALGIFMPMWDLGKAAKG